MAHASDTPALRVGVALGAGSAAAMAELGALEVLAEAGVPVNCAAGTSAGAIVGAALANGRLGELRACLEQLSRRRVLRLFDLAWPREGFLHGRRALELVRPFLGDTIEALELPDAAVATPCEPETRWSSPRARFSMPCVRASPSPGSSGLGA